MSRIKKALEKAKSENEKAGTGEIHRPRLVVKPKEHKTPVYSQTQVVQVPEDIFLNNRIMATDEKCPVTDQFKRLRTRVFQVTRLKGWNTILISGFGIGEGKSLLSANLAVSMARDTRQTTLLVDLDLRKPTLGTLFGLGNDFTGIEAFFLDDVPLQEIMISPGISKLTILPAKGGVINPTELIGSPKMEALVREMKERYDDRYIIFDSPAINICPDPIVISEYMDAIILVARAGQTFSDDVTTAIEQINREKLLGVVLNDVRDVRSSAYSYY